MNRRSLIKTLGGSALGLMAPYVSHGSQNVIAASSAKEINWWPFQKEIIEKAKIRGVNLFLMPRGSGKTFIYKHLAGINLKDYPRVGKYFYRGFLPKPLKFYSPIIHNRSIHCLFMDEFYENDEGVISSYLKYFKENDRFVNIFFSLSLHEKEIKQIKDSGEYNFYHYTLKDILDKNRGFYYEPCLSSFKKVMGEDHFRREILCEFTV